MRINRRNFEDFSNENAIFEDTNMIYIKKIELSRAGAQFFITLKIRKMLNFEDISNNNSFFKNQERDQFDIRPPRKNFLRRGLKYLR